MRTVQTESPRECPYCRRMNASGSAVCECGYDFTTARKEAGPAQRFISAGDFAIVEEGALVYRRLVRLVGFGVLVAAASPVLPFAVEGDAALVVALVLGSLAGLIITVLTVRTAHRLADILDAKPPILYAIGFFLPGVSLMMLLVLSSRATAWARRYGLEVGLLGPTPASLEALRYAQR
jgi:hypothetical protein